MRKLIVSEFLSLDGVMQAPGGPDEDPSGGFDQGGWQMQFGADETAANEIVQGLSQMGGLVLGRITYEIFAGYWPNAGRPEPFAGLINRAPKYVASRTLREPLGWENSAVLGDDVPGAIRRLKEGDGNDLFVIGSGQLAQTLMANDLIDEYRLMIHPLLLGSGKRLFREPNTPRRLRLAQGRVSEKGVFIATYVPEGS